MLTFRSFHFPNAPLSRHLVLGLERWPDNMVGFEGPDVILGDHGTKHNPCRSLVPASNPFQWIQEISSVSHAQLPLLTYTGSQ